MQVVALAPSRQKGAVPRDELADLCIELLLTRIAPPAIGIRFDLQYNHAAEQGRIEWSNLIAAIGGIDCHDHTMLRCELVGVQGTLLPLCRWFDEFKNGLQGVFLLGAV